MEFKKLESYPNYLISKCGKIKNKKTNKIRKPWIGTGGYEVIRLGKGLKNEKVHRLVAKTWLEKKEGCDLVNHKDGNRRNNNSSNLEWCTPGDNMKHKNAVTRENILKLYKSKEWDNTEEFVLAILDLK
jgi:hypothetical protein